MIAREREGGKPENALLFCFQKKYGPMTLNFLANPVADF
jgi:hypothetical protein